MQNVLLASVLPEEFSRLSASLCWTTLCVGQRLQTDGHLVERVYFPESGLVSLMSGTGERKVETAIVGRDGLVGAAALLGNTASSHSAVVRVAGSAWFLPAAELRLARRDNSDLDERLLRFVGAWIAQTEQSISAISRYTVDQRLARWLLMAHDRLDEHELAITHECLAHSLCVRRPSVTVALHVLEGERAIRSDRGRVTIRDRDRLKQLAGDAYRGPEVEGQARPPSRPRPQADVSRHAPAIVQ